MHVPVLLDECIEALAIRPDGQYADYTLGRAGHSSAIASRLTTGRLYAFDRDGDAIEQSKPLLSNLPATLIRADFRDAALHLEPESLDGILIDLGVSSPQIDTPQRGFSYMADTDQPIDMRMDLSAGFTAQHIVNTYEHGQLVRILRDYGEEKFAPQIAKSIIAHRPLESTRQLVLAIKDALPAKALYGGHHPAMRTFQALRIETNDELGALKAALESVPTLLKSGGRLLCISFHSLEDRIVKGFMQKWQTGCDCPPDFPVCICGKKPIMRIISKKPITPSAKELEKNPRSHSAKLRICQKI